MISIMSEWKKLKIEELCSKVTSGGTPLRKKTEYYTGKIPWIKTGELKGWYIYDTDEMITDDAIENSSAKLYPADTILMAMYGDGRTIGSVGITGVEATSNQACCAMIPNKTKCDPYFLLFALKNYSNELVNLALGGAQRNLNQRTIREFEINVPNIDVQQRIGEQLSNFNQLIENNTRRIAILEEMARLIYREWFVHYRYPGHENDRLMDSGTELGKVPEGWGVVRFEEIFDIAYGKTLPTKNLVDNGKYLVYGAGDVIGRYTEKNVDKKLALITCRGNGSGTVWRTRGEGFVTNNSLILNPKSKVQSFFYNYHLAEHSNISSVITGSAQPQITISNLSTLKTVFGNRGVIEQFNSKIEPIYKQIDNLFVTNKKLKETRDLLLPKLISGRIPI